MKTLHLVLAVCLGSTIAAAEELTWQDLVSRPEVRPTQCTVKKAMKFKSGASVQAGQKVNILKFEPNQIVISTMDGRVTFAASPTDTDVLAVANEAWAKLTPAQRGLTYASLLKRPDLWPWSVKLTAAYEFSGGRRMNKGDTVYLMTVKNGELVVCPSQFDMHFEVAPDATDILTFARKYVDNKDGAPGRLVQELDGKLINAATSEPAPLKSDPMPRYYVIYHAARWCPYTQKFTPDLLKLYKEMRPKNPEFEVIYVPVEKSAAELQLYAKELNFPWPAVDFNKKNQLAVLGWVLGHSSTPELGVFDRYGNTVIDPATVDRDEALKQLAELWKKSPEK
ncbi:MAG TPA: thioredoxin-like domain-containing protein [Verrucomicrobiae bacterium]|nr:thioredoxin-like domain-containing protein [Verrucomicrobiae bacterium]